MDYKEAIDFIKKTYKFGSKLGLTNMNKLLELLDNPQEKLHIIHVAGTNGKGSTCAFLHSILQESGYKVGLYTSPSMEGFTGRIKINQEKISEKSFAYLAQRVKEKIDILTFQGLEHPTEFEVITAMALLYFHEEKADFVVLEVGLGGRLDATNIIENPILSIITPIGYDHMEYLGETLGKIAFEKAGIVKNDNLVVSAIQQDEAMEAIYEVAREKNSELFKVNLDSLKIHENGLESQSFSVQIMNEEYTNVKITLLGTHQIENACLALTAIEVLKRNRKIMIKKRSIYNGLYKTRWPGRFEIIRNNPLTIIDGAHNVHAAQRLKETIEKVILNKPIILVIGMLGDKDVSGVLNDLVPLSKEVVVTKPNNSRALSAEELESKVNPINTKTHICTNIENALEKAKEICPKDGVILVAGSLYLIDSVRKLIIGK